MNIFILEDDIGYRMPLFRAKLAHQKVYWAESADEGIEILKYVIKEGISLDYIFLDHDLGGRIYVESDEHNTGMTVAKFIRDNDIKVTERIILHTLNSWGADNMKAVLPIAEIVPFPKLIENLREE